MTDRKVAFVTAAAGAGIGAAIARRLANDGYEVVITDAHERRCGEFAAALEAEHERTFLSIPLDVTDHEAVGNAIKQATDHYGRLDVLVNNAGWSKIEPVAEMSMETWQRCLDVDLTGTFSCMRHALPIMIGQGSGSIVN
ncbi:MAG: SDR family NAD(P)-dependent oxidoreductase, partial [Chloroflexota bacterium]